MTKTAEQINKERAKKTKIIPVEYEEAIAELRGRNNLENREEKLEASLKKKKRPVNLAVQKFVLNYLPHFFIIREIERAGGLIHISHLIQLTGLSSAELYESLDVLHASAIINLIDLKGQHLIQLTNFTVTQLRSCDSKQTTLANSTILRQVLLGEIVTSMMKKSSEDRESFLDTIEKDTNFFRTTRTGDDLKKWATIDTLKRQDAYLSFNENNDKDTIVVYLLDLYNSSSRQLANRIAKIQKYLQEEHIVDADISQKYRFDQTDAWKNVIFRVCVEDNTRKKSLDSKSAVKVVDNLLLKKNILHLYLEREIISFDLTEKYFKNKRF